MPFCHHVYYTLLSIIICAHVREPSLKYPSFHSLYLSHRLDSFSNCRIAVWLSKPGLSESRRMDSVQPERQTTDSLYWEPTVPERRTLVYTSQRTSTGPRGAISVVTSPSITPPIAAAHVGLSTDFSLIRLFVCL